MRNTLNYVEPDDPVDNMYFICQSLFGQTSKVYFRKMKLILHLIILLISMTQILTHGVAHSAKPSSRPKKSFGQLSKSCQKLGVTLENKVVSKEKFSKKCQ